jgi:hypothetical protein
MSMAESEVEWTRAQQANALKAIEIVRAVVSSDDQAHNVVAGAEEIVKLIPGGVSATNDAFADVAPDIITGLVNVAGTLVEQAAAGSAISVEQVITNLVEGVRSVKVVD